MLNPQQQEEAGDAMPGVRLIHRDNKVIFDLETGLVFFENEHKKGDPRIISLGTRENEILKLLLKKNGLIVSRSEILDVIWEGRIVCENTVAVALSNIRKVIRNFDSKCSCLLTISKKGYLFYPHRSGLYLEHEIEKDVYVQTK